MALNPRAPRGRPNPHRNGPGPGPPSTTDPRRRRPARAKHRPDREPAPEATATTLEALLDDFTESWERGEGPRAERYVEFLEPEDSVELIYHEYCLAEASDLTPNPADYLRRFPDHADRLARLFALHGAFPSSTLRDWAEPPELPSSGDEIGPYRLVRELGRGTFARVFLAEQVDLDHRLVVLKVSTRSTAEPRLLARARHPHIVEVLRHATTDDGGLHLVCMPFLGGATLATVLEVRRTIGRRPRTGRDFLADLDRATAPEYPKAELVGPAREILDRLSYSQSLAWIVARLAEALDHAYGRGVAHGDLKPSNVLITAGGVPLLLDMNLSTDWHAADALAEGPAADLGGTLAYMAPERLSAIARGGEGASSKAVDSQRADLYALGLVLLETLTGEPPEVPRARAKEARELAVDLAWLRRSLPGPLLGRGDHSIPPALRSILAKCLAPDPLDRYTRGNELAEDLDLWRSDRPLAIAEEPGSSVLARSVRRRRFPLIATGLTLIAAVIVAWVAWGVLKGSAQKNALSWYSTITDQPDSGALHFRQVGQWRDDELSDPAEASARQLARYDVLSDSAADWRDRDDVRSLPDRERGELEAWIFEQILRHAIALRQRDDSTDWKRGLDLLDRTLARDSSAPLEAERANLLERLKRPDRGPVASTRPSLPRWMDEYLAGVAAEPLHFREALEHYLEALRGRPGMHWAHYRAAAAACRIGEDEIAVKQLRRCVDRCPDNPALRLQLAALLSYAERNSPGSRIARPFASALAECDRAIDLDPDYPMAYRIRAWVRQASGWSEGARDDHDRYAALTRRGGPAPALGLGFGLKFQAGTNFTRPPDDLPFLARKVLDNNPRDHRTRAGLAIAAVNDRPKEAIAELDRVVETDPEHLLARYLKAVFLTPIDPQGAIDEYSALIKEPRIEELFREDPSAFRAFLHVASDLMNRGRISEALEVANRALVHVNRSRSLSNEAIIAFQKDKPQVKISPRGETYYLLARIHAAAARTDRDHVSRVIENLNLAFAKNEKFREGWFAKDRHFDALRAEILERIPRIVADR